MKRSLLACAVLACAASMAACATTDQPLTLAQKLSFARDTVEITCDLAQSLAQAGEIHGKDAERAAIACATARTTLAALQANLPPEPAASSPGS